MNLRISGGGEIQYLPIDLVSWLRAQLECLSIIASDIGPEWLFAKPPSHCMYLVTSHTAYYKAQRVTKSNDQGHDELILQKWVSWPLFVQMFNFMAHSMVGDLSPKDEEVTFTSAIKHDKRGSTINWVLYRDREIVRQLAITYEYKSISQVDFTSFSPPPQSAN